MGYQQIIREILAHVGRIGVDLRYIEAFMRSAHGTLDALSPSEFRREVEVAIACVDMADRLAQSFGL